MRKVGMRFFDAKGERIDKTPWQRRRKLIWEIPRSTYIAFILLAVAFSTAAATQINLASQVKGLLAIANGGTNTATFTAHGWFGNNTGSTAAPGVETPGTNDLTPQLYAACAGTAQAQTLTLAPAATALVTGLMVRCKPVAANTAAAPTLAVSGLTATAITKCGTVALVANDLNTTAISEFFYDGTEFQVLNPQQTPCGALLTGTFADAETPSGTINGANTTFTLAHTPSPSADLQLYKNGQQMIAGGADYTLATATITMVTAPATGDVLIAFYRY
jgi:hypothetical protein